MIKKNIYFDDKNNFYPNSQVYPNKTYIEANKNIYLHDEHKRCSHHHPGDIHR